jgi:aminopeptidase-like protein
MKQSHVYYSAKLDLEELVDVITSNVDHETVQDFVISIDEYMADWDFSVSLINKLLRSMDSNFVIVADEQKKDGSVAVQIDEKMVAKASIRQSTGVLEISR